MSVPATTRPRQRLRPRTIVLLLLVCVGLSLLIYAGVVSWRRSAAIAWVEAVGGSIEFEGDAPPYKSGWFRDSTPEWARAAVVVYLMDVRDFDLRQITALRETQALLLTGPGVDDSDLQPVGAFSQLEEIVLSRTRIGSAGLDYLRRCPRLTYLSIPETGIDDQALLHLAGAELSMLVLSKTRVTDAGLRHLSSIPLKALSLNDLPVTDAGLEALRGMPLEMLDLSGTRVTDDGLGVLAGLPLRRLCLNRTAVTDAGVAQLKELPLRQLSLIGTAVKPQAVAELQAARPGLRIEFTPPAQSVGTAAAGE